MLISDLEKSEETFKKELSFMEQMSLVKRKSNELKTPDSLFSLQLSVRVSHYSLLKYEKFFDKYNFGNTKGLVLSALLDYAITHFEKLEEEETKPSSKSNKK